MAQAVAVRQDPTPPPAAGSDDGDAAHQVALASVVVPTHNDGPNIGLLLERLIGEPCVGELIVVASGCDDDTVGIVCRTADVTARAATADPAATDAVTTTRTTADSAAADAVTATRTTADPAATDAVTATRPPTNRRVPVHVYVEPLRSGKTAAVNFGVGRCTLPAVVIVSGDVLPEPGAVGHLVAALGEPGVGMAGGRPVPVNAPTSVIGAAVHLLWRLHHRLALRQPKLGEMVALRAEAAVVLPETSVDEACFQARLEAAGWASRYVPAAVVANRGPGTLPDLVKQRRQIHTGHLWLRRREGYTVPSLRPGVLVRELCAELAELRAERQALHPGRIRGTLVAAVLELWARLLARLDYLRGRETYVWDMVTSAKDPALGPHGVGARSR